MTFVELLEMKKTFQIMERREKEEKAKLLHDLSQARVRLGEEKERNDNVQRVKSCLGYTFYFDSHRRLNFELSKRMKHWFMIFGSNFHDTKWS
jgi:hypothetical protein